MYSISYIRKLISAIIAPVKLHGRYVAAMGRISKDSSSIVLYPNVISIGKDCSIHLGRGCYIGAFAEIVVTGLRRTRSSSVKLEIGNDTSIGAFSNIRAHVNSVFIGSGVLIGQHVSIVSSNHSRSNKSGLISRFEVDEKVLDPVVIGDGAWVGAGSIILPGVAIGRNAIVGAGSIVTKNIGDGEVWFGYSARKIS